MTTDHSAAPARDVLRDAFIRIAELVNDCGDHLSADLAVRQPAPGANTISWLLWHLTRVQDDHVSDLAGAEQRWTANGWADELSLGFATEATGYGQSPEDVARVHTAPALLARYHRDVHAATLAYLDHVTAEELARVVDDQWDPPVTASARLVSVLSDCLQHLGQVAYVQGLLERD